MNIKTKALKKSLWVYHVSGGSCNNCDIEILDCLTPRFDIERFGIVLVGSPRHADVLLCTGIVNKKCVERLREVYKQTAKPCIVVAIGACACTGGIFRDGYQMGGPIDKLIPVDVYIPGCPPKPEAMIAGIVKVLEKLK
ncbi:MAG: NADH-quinone oxidoreductase subunit B family protein [bacterium]|nr:NADH-quinone oxidoreductase subunit B family protein [bacterium]